MMNFHHVSWQRNSWGNPTVIGLYNLKNDQGEDNNLNHTKPQIIQEMVQEVKKITSKWRMEPYPARANTLAKIAFKDNVYQTDWCKPFL